MQPFLGQIALFPYNFTPENWMPCTGQLMQINQNQALFALIGTNFGGDGQTTFGLPNLQGKAPAAHLQYFIATNGVFPQRTN
jgi:microcystin-dependent protein